MSILDTVKLWRNCVACQTDPKKCHLHQESERIKNAIYQEWNRRRRSVRTDEYFSWPSTEAQRGRGQLDADQWQPDGMLKYMGYQVGQSSELSIRQRQAILGEIFRSVLPPVFPDEYLDQFGQPKSSQRLQKIAEAIAAFTRNAKRRAGTMDMAIRDWERDLEYLYYTYYVEHFGFTWPSTCTS